MDAEYPCYLISRQFQSRSAGCSANTIGVSGTLNWRSTRRMCRSLRVEGRRLMDMGAGDGQFMVSDLANGTHGHGMRASSKPCATVDITLCT